MRLPLALNYGMARASVGAGGNLVNLYAQKAAVGARDDVVLIGAPGTRPFVQLQYLNDEEEEADDTNVNGLIFAFNKIVAVTDNAVYLVAENGTVTRRANGGLAAPVSMAFNRIDVAAVSPEDGGLWINESEAVAITDPDFYPADAVTFIDSYLIFSRHGTGQVFSTGSYTRAIDGLDFADAEKAPDNAAGVMAAGDNLFIFGEASTEAWYNAGNAQFPFSRTPGATLEHGCAAIATACQFDGAVTWLTPGGLVMRAAGLVPQRISDEAVETALAERRADWSAARAYVYSDEGHTFYVLTVGNLTLAYDDATRWWHQRSNYSRGHAIGQCYVRAWGRHFVGDGQGRILELSSAVYEDAGEPLIAEVVTIPYTSDRKVLRIGTLELEIDVGVGRTGVSAEIMMAQSKSKGVDGVVWGPDRTASLGAPGEYGRRVRWGKLGGALSRRFRFRISAPVPRRILSKADLMVGEIG